VHIKTSQHTNNKPKISVKQNLNSLKKSDCYGRVEKL